MKGRKRHIAVDTQGLLLGVVVHAANIQDADGAGALLRRVKALYWGRLQEGAKCFCKRADLIRHQLQSACKNGRSR